MSIQMFIYLFLLLIFLLISLSMAPATQFFGSSSKAVIPAKCQNKKKDGINQFVCKQLIGWGVYYNNLTVVAVILSVTLQLKVLVPHAQFLPAGEPHAEALQYQQTLKDVDKHRLIID